MRRAIGDVLILRAGYDSSRVRVKLSGTSVPNPKSRHQIRGRLDDAGCVAPPRNSANYSSSSRLASAADPPPTLATDFGSGTLAPRRPPCYARTTGSVAGRGRTMRTMRLGGRRRGPRTLGLVLSGGGARGAFQVGVYERLLEDARFAAGPAVISGTSAGGINAALIAAGKSPREMLQFWKSIADDPPVTASAAFFGSALRTLARLSLEEAARWLGTSQPLRAFLHRVRNHRSLRPGNVLAL